MLVLPRISQAERIEVDIDYLDTIKQDRYFSVWKIFLIFLVRSPQSMLGKVWWNNWCQLLYWAVRNLVHCFRRGPGTGTPGRLLCCDAANKYHRQHRRWMRQLYQIKSSIIGNSASSHLMITDNEHFYRGLCMMVLILYAVQDSAINVCDQTDWIV